LYSAGSKACAAYRNTWQPLLLTASLHLSCFLQVIRPGGFTANYIRSSGLKEPVLVKGDRFNENPQMGLMWPDVHSISVDVLADYIGGERKVRACRPTATALAQAGAACRTASSCS
jgi:hypothetical protein